MDPSVNDNGVVDGLIAFAVGAILCFVFSIGFTFRFRSSRIAELSKLSTFVVIFSLFFTLLSACLVPLDVFLVSSMKTYDGHFKPWAVDPVVRSNFEWKVQQAYYALYGIILVFAFLILPFAYFFLALKGEDEEPERLATKLCRAMKYTLASVVFFGLLVLIGILLPFDGVPPPNESSLHKLQFIIDSFKSSHGDNLIVFLMNVINIIGIVLIIIYVAYGMTSLPLGMIYGQRTVASERASVEDQLKDLEAQISTIRNQYAENETQMPHFEAQQVERLEREVRLLRRSHFDLDQRSRTFANRCAACWRPIQVFLGICLALNGFLVFVTLLLVSVDKAMHSLGPYSGYALPNATLPNPFDIILVFAQELFPLDYVLYSWIIVFFVMCSISGLKNLGIRFLWLTVYKIRPYSTKPQALILMSLNLIFITMAVSVIIFSTIPDYTTYGSQNYAVNVSTDGIPSQIVKRCSGINAPTNECVMSRIAMLLLVFHSKAWIFGAAFFWLVWMFLLMIVVMSIWCFMRFRREQVVQEGDDLEELLDDAEPFAQNEA